MLENFFDQTFTSTFIEIAYGSVTALVTGDIFWSRLVRDDLQIWQPCWHTEAVAFRDPLQEWGLD